jgi:glucose-1-phosphate thymidylyltransferase
MALSRLYTVKATLTYEVLEGWWTDAGTFDSLLRANNLVAEAGANKMILPAGRASECSFQESAR